MREPLGWCIHPNFGPVREVSQTPDKDAVARPHAVLATVVCNEDMAKAKWAAYDLAKGAHASERARP